MKRDPPGRRGTPHMTEPSVSLTPHSGLLAVRNIIHNTDYRDSTLLTVRPGPDSYSGLRFGSNCPRPQ